MPHIYPGVYMPVYIPRGVFGLPGIYAAYIPWGIYAGIYARYAFLDGDFRFFGRMPGLGFFAAYMLHMDLCGIYAGCICRIYAGIFLLFFLQNRVFLFMPGTRHICRIYAVVQIY